MSVIYPANQSWTQTTLDKPMMDYLWSQIELAKGDFKPELVGHISKSLNLPDTEGRLTDLVISESKHLNIDVTEMEKFWVNYQKKYEFNPLHAHSGKISFVIWMKIPYYYEDEMTRPEAGNINERTLSGCFLFYYLKKTVSLEFSF